MALVYRGVHVQRSYCKMSSPNLSSTLQRCASQLVWGVFADMMCLVFIKPLPRSCYREEAFYCHPFETSHTFSVFSLVGLSWTWTCNMLPEACRVWDEALFYLFGFFSQLSIVLSDLGADILGCSVLGRLWYCINTHLIAPDQQTAKNLNF